MKIRIDPLDKLFSLVVRLRDKKCVRCGSVRSLQCSHFWGRTTKNTRWDEENGDTLCFPCHVYWGSRPAEYADWKLAQLGQERYDMLKIRASRVPNSKVDKSMIEVFLKSRIKELEG